jgi:Icc-related predicted phosphoesterase
MRILHVADLHLRWFDWVKANATAYDLLVIAGDLQDLFANLSAQTQALQCSEWLSTLSTPTVICSGNHDIWENPHMPSELLSFKSDWLQRLGGKSSIIAADGQSVEFHGVEIASVGWLQQPVWPRSTDIVVAHAPPAASWCASEEFGSRDLGDSDLRAAINQHPTALLVLSGHVHEPRRRWSRMQGNGSLVLVPGCDLTAEQPWHWTIDTIQGRATWHGHPEDPVEEISLFPGDSK